MLTTISEDLNLNISHQNTNLPFLQFQIETLTGMGNFPIAIYYKLMDGLKDKIPDEKERKKHIIEKMLFMGELNKKNCFVVKQIFNINNTYKLNLSVNIKL